MSAFPGRLSAAACLSAAVEVVAAIDGGGGGGGGLTGIGAGSAPFGGITEVVPAPNSVAVAAAAEAVAATNGADGSLGAGGAGGSAGGSSGGGGGGGGYYGGGGGGGQCRRWWGSGFGPVGTTFTDGVQGGDGVVVISYTRITTSVSLTFVAESIRLRAVDHAHGDGVGSRRNAERNGDLPRRRNLHRHPSAHRWRRDVLDLVMGCRQPHDHGLVWW